MSDKPKTRTPIRVERPQRSAGPDRAASTEPGAPEGEFLALQRAIGARSVGRLLSSGLLWPRLRVGAVDHPLEREAERVSAAVVSGSPAGGVVEPSSAGPVGLAPRLTVRRQRLEDEDEEIAQPKKAAGPPPGPDPGLESRWASLRGRGRPLPPASRAFFEGRLGHGFGDVRVHTGAGASEAARAIGARAFTVGRDIVFGGGEWSPESRAGQRLLAHELTHVVQHGGSGGGADAVMRRQPTAEPAVETMPEGPEAAAASAEAAAPRQRETAGATAAPGRLVDDEAEPGPGQMRKGRFLSAVNEAACTAADDALAGTELAATGCPWLSRYFQLYEERTAAQVEADVLRYVPAASRAATAQDYIPLVASWVQESIRGWMEGGGPSDGLRRAAREMSAAGGIGGALAEIGRLLFKSRAGGARRGANPAAVRAELGAGRPLVGAPRSRMERAFGQGFPGVRIHTGGTARRLSSRFNARAFAVGEHVAFGSGEYRPGTPIGDALLAHELAHVVQQGGNRGGREALGASGARASEAALEAEADAAAMAALPTRLLGIRGRARPARRTRGAGLRLQRCTRTETPAPTQEATPAKESQPEDWNFTPSDFAKLVEAKKKLKMASDSTWVAQKLQDNIIATLNHLLDPNLTPSATTGVSVEDLYHGHLALPKSATFAPALREAKKEFEAEEEKVEKDVLGGTTLDVPAAKVPAYTKAMKERLLPKLAVVFNEAAKVTGAVVIYHTFEHNMPAGMKVGDPRRNWKTPLDTNVPEPYSPPDINNASSWMREFSNVIQFSFLVDREGGIHVRTGSDFILSTVTGRASSWGRPVR